MSDVRTAVDSPKADKPSPGLVGEDVPKGDVGPLYSITSSAVAKSAGGTEIPSASAVLRLITISNFSGRCIGKSLGLAPCRILPTYTPHRRNSSARFGP